MAKDVSRRDFLTRLPALFARSVTSAARSMGAAAGAGRAAETIAVPSLGSALDGLPVASEWIATAWACGNRLGRRFPYGFLLGASGEAFRIAWSREDPAAAAAAAPLNTFLAALAAAGLVASATAGGPYEPALGGAETAAGRGAVMVLGTAGGPVLLAGVDRRAGEVVVARAGPGPSRVPLAEFGRGWAGGRWPGGPAAYLRVQVTAGPPPRPLREMAPLAVRTALLALEDHEAGGVVRGLAAWVALAGDLRAGAIPAERLGDVFGGLFAAAVAGRAAAGPFLESIAPALPVERQPAVLEAADLFRQVHRGDPTGALYGSGLLPEAAECLLAGGRPDPGRLADLLLAVHDRESRAATLLAEAADAPLPRA